MNSMHCMVHGVALTFTSGTEHRFVNKDIGSSWLMSDGRSICRTDRTVLRQRGELAGMRIKRTMGRE